MDPDDAHDILPEIIDDLISYDDARYKRVLELYYTEDAELIHTFLNTKGTHNIRKVFRVWTSLNRDPPEIKDYPIYNGNVVILNLTQHLRPRIFPFIHFDVSSVTVLRLREQENGKLYIYRQEDSWTLEGLIQSVPIISWWYDNIVRPIFAAAATCAGGFLYTANTATSRLSDRANEVRDTSNSAISQGQVKAISMAHSITSGVKTRIRHARRGVISHYNKVRGNNNKKEYRYVSEPTGLEYGDDDDYDLE